MTMMMLRSSPLLLLLLLGCGIIASLVDASAPFADLRHNYCGLTRERRWPWDRRRDGELNPEANDGVFRILTEDDVRAVKPGKEYLMSLRALAPDVPISRFLITAADDQDGTGCGYGRLRSLSDVSEHVNYACGRFLLDRSGAEGGAEGLLEVPFTWEPPSCGCVTLRAQVLDADDNLYTSDDDPSFGMSVLACVEGTSFEDEAVKRWQQVEREVEREEQEVDRLLLRRRDLLESTYIHHAGDNKRRLRRNARRHCCSGGISARCSDCDEDTFLHTCDDGQPSDELFAYAEEREMGHELCWDMWHDCCLGERSIVDFKADENVEKRKRVQKAKKKKDKARRRRKTQNAKDKARQKREREKKREARQERKNNDAAEKPY